MKNWLRDRIRAWLQVMPPLPSAHSPAQATPIERWSLRYAEEARRQSLDTQRQLEALAKALRVVITIGPDDVDVSPTSGAPSAISDARSFVHSAEMLREVLRQNDKAMADAARRLYSQQRALRQADL